MESLGAEGQTYVFRNSNNFGVRVTPMNGMFNGRFFGPRPWGLGEGPKGLIKKLCVSSHKCNRRIFIRSPGSCLRSGTWGYRGGLGDHFLPKISKI